MATMMFGNATGLPLALMPVILASAPYLGSPASAALCVMLYGILNKVRRRAAKHSKIRASQQKQESHGWPTRPSDA